MTRSKDVSFPAGEGRCAARLYLPDHSASPPPVVVMVHGATGTMDFGLARYASRFTERGMAVLCFDFRHFGASPGEPRQVIDVDQQLDDVRAALAYVRSHAPVDRARVALWGTSLGAGHAVSIAAEDPGVRAVVAQLPFFGVDVHRKDPRPTSVTLRLFGLAVLDLVGGWLGRPARTFPLLGRPGEFAVFAGEDDYEPLRELERTAPTWSNALAARSLFSLLRYRPADVADQVTVPLLILAAEQDSAASMTLTEAVAKQAPQVDLRLYPGSHFSAYTGPVFDAMAKDEADFLSLHLYSRRHE